MFIFLWYVSGAQLGNLPGQEVYLKQSRREGLLLSRIVIVIYTDRLPRDPGFVSKASSQSRRNELRLRNYPSCIFLFKSIQ